MSNWNKEILFARKYFTTSQDLFALVWRRDNKKLTDKDKNLIDKMKKEYDTIKW